MQEYIKINKKIKDLSNQAACLYGFLVLYKNKSLSRAYMAKILNVKDLDTISDHLNKLVKAGLIKISHYYAGYNKKRFRIHIVASKSYFLVKKSFFYNSLDPVRRGFILRLRCFCWDDSLKLCESACEISKSTLKKYLGNNLTLPCMGAFFRQLNKFQKKVKQTLNQTVSKIKSYFDVSYRKAKWALDHFTGKNPSIYNWLISGVRKKSFQIIS